VEQIVVADADVEEIAGSDAGRVVVVVLGAWAGREIRSSHIRTSMWSAERPASAAGFHRKDRPGVAGPSEASQIYETGGVGDRHGTRHQAVVIAPVEADHGPSSMVGIADGLSG